MLQLGSAPGKGFWARHRWKMLLSLGVAGAGYAAYRFYDARQKQLVRVEQRAEEERAADEIIKNQLQAHFENVQRISDTTTLPFAMHYLRSRIVEELDISHLTERLLQGKGELTPEEKYETWEKIKILSFTRTVTSMWAMTLLSLYVRVQVTILGRHLYLDFARGTDGAQLQAESDTFSGNGHKDFLGTADYLATYGITALIRQMQHAATEILKEKQLKDPMSMDQVSQTMLQISDQFMSLCEDNSWINFLVPENANRYAQLMAVSSSGFDDSSLLMDVRKLDQLMTETRIVSYDVRARPNLVESTSGSRDLQMVRIGLRVLTRPMPERLPTMYRTLGENYNERVLPSIIHETLKAVVAQYNASQLITQREAVSREIRNLLTERAKNFNIALDDVSITSLSFGKEFTHAIEAKQVAAQEAERAKFIVEKAEQDKKSAIIRAQGEAKSAELIGNAIANNPAFVALRQIEAAREIAHTIAASNNKVFLDSGDLLLGLQSLKMLNNNNKK